MKLNIIIVISCFLMVSCGHEEVKSENTNSVKTKTVADPIDTNTIVNQDLEIDTTLNVLIVDVPFTYSYLMEEEVTLLKDYLLESNIQSLDLSLVNLSEAESDTAIITNFLNLIKITDLFKDSARDAKGYLDPMTADETFAILTEAILGFKNSCMAECTEYDCAIEMKKFYDLANKTTGSLDNDFFELIEIMDGDRYTSSHNFKNWFGQVWDYGGGTLLGDSTHYRFLNKAKIIKSKTTLVDRFLDRYITECATDVLHGIYMYSPEKVVEEIEMITSLKIIDLEIESKIIELKTTILSGDYTWKKCVGGELQFNCAEGDCDFGG